MIALYWKKLDVPSKQVWVKEMASCIVMEKLSYITRAKAEEFEAVWKPLMEFLSRQGVQ